MVSTARAGALLLPVPSKSAACDVRGTVYVHSTCQFALSPPMVILSTPYFDLRSITQTPSDCQRGTAMHTQAPNTNNCSWGQLVRVMT